MGYAMFNPTYFLFALPALLLGLYAQYKVKTAYNRYQKVANQGNLGGLEAARRLLALSGLTDVEVNTTRGQLSDHYDPRKKALFLSEGVARSASVASLGIVAHEVGHAVQDLQAYMPLKLRAGMVPMVQLGSWLGPIIFILGMVLSVPGLSTIGLILFSGTLVFSLVTLPVEFDASKRAVAMLNDGGLIGVQDEKGVRAVLQAAALTYVAAAIQAISTLLYYVYLLGGRRRR